MAPQETGVVVIFHNATTRTRATGAKQLGDLRSIHPPLTLPVPVPADGRPPCFRSRRDGTAREPGQQPLPGLVSASIKAFRVISNRRTLEYWANDKKTRRAQGRANQTKPHCRPGAPGEPLHSTPLPPPPGAAARRSAHLQLQVGHRARGEVPGRPGERRGMADGGGESESTALEFTPTWIVAAVCSLIVVISLAAERCLHYLGKVTDFDSSLRVFLSIETPRSSSPS